MRDFYGIYGATLKGDDRVRTQTRDLLRSFNIGPWLIGFNMLGDAIDAASEEHSGGLIGCYDYLSSKYGRDKKRLDDDIRRAVGIAWREQCPVMERLMGRPLNRPPSPRNFIYAAAEYLNRAEKEEMMN